MAGEMLLPLMNEGISMIKKTKITKKEERRRIIRLYCEKTGKSEYTMRDVARFAADMGYKLPEPKDPLDMLAEQFAQAAREETRKDAVTGLPYRANLAVTTWQSGEQMTLWSDIDQAPRKFAHKSLAQRRGQMVDDGVQLTLDAEHWNRVHADEEPIQMQMDFTDDVEERINALSEDDEAA